MHGRAALFFSWSFLRLFSGFSFPFLILFLYFSYTFLILFFCFKRKEKEKKRKRKYQEKEKKRPRKDKKRQEKPENGAHAPTQPQLPVAHHPRPRSRLSTSPASPTHIAPTPAHDLDGSHGEVEAVLPHPNVLLCLRVRDLPLLHLLQVRLDGLYILLVLEN